MPPKVVESSLSSAGTSRDTSGSALSCGAHQCGELLWARPCLERVPTIAPSASRRGPPSSARRASREWPTWAAGRRSSASAASSSSWAPSAAAAPEREAVGAVVMIAEATTNCFLSRTKTRPRGDWAARSPRAGRAYVVGRRAGAALGLGRRAAVSALSRPGWFQPSESVLTKVIQQDAGTPRWCWSSTRSKPSEPP